jgi:hypothetical protein
MSLSQVVMHRKPAWKTPLPRSRALGIFYIAMVLAGLIRGASLTRAIGTKMFDPELETFKRAIDLRAYASAHAYQLDKRESWAGSSVMRAPNGDKISIKRLPNGVWVYYSFRNDRDNGTILDFVQYRLNLSLGAARKELRPWIGAPPVPVPVFPPLEKTASKNRDQIEQEFARMQDAGNHAWLVNTRGIPADVLSLERFAGRVRVDDRNNVVFPHFDRDGICGYEIRNAAFKGAQGKKGLWLSHEMPDDARLVIGESALDMLAFAALYPNARTRFASIGGYPSTQQKELIQAAIQRMPDGSEIVSAMDADDAGVKLNEIVHEQFEQSGLTNLRFLVHVPEGAKDFNDLLQRTQPGQSPARLLGLDAG